MQLGSAMRLLPCILCISITNTYLVHNIVQKQLTTYTYPMTQFTTYIWPDKLDQDVHTWDPEVKLQQYILYNILILKWNYNIIDYTVYVEYSPKGQKEPFRWLQSSTCRLDTVSYFAPHTNFNHKKLLFFQLQNYKNPGKAQETSTWLVKLLKWHNLSYLNCLLVTDRKSSYNY